MLPGFVNSSDEEEQKKKSSHNRKKSKKTRVKRSPVSSSFCSTKTQISDFAAQIYQDDGSMIASNIGTVGDQKDIISSKNVSSHLPEIYLAQGARPKRTNGKCNLPKIPTEQQPVGGADGSMLDSTLNEVYLMQGAKPKKSCDSSSFHKSMMWQYNTNIEENIPVSSMQLGFRSYDINSETNLFSEHTRGVVQQSIPGVEGSNMPLQEMTTQFQRLSVTNTVGAINTRGNVTNVSNDLLKRVRSAHIGYIWNLCREMFYITSDGNCQMKDEIIHELSEITQNINCLVSLIKLELITQFAIALDFKELSCALMHYQINSLNMYALNVMFGELMNIVSCDSRSSLFKDKLYDIFVPYADTEVVNSGCTSSSGAMQYSTLVVMLSELMFAKKNNTFCGKFVYYVNFAMVSCYYRLGCMYCAITQYSPSLQGLFLQDPLGDMKQRCVDTCCGMVYMYYIGPEYNNGIKIIEGVAFPSLLLDICDSNIERHFMKSIKQANKLNFSYVMTNISAYITANLSEDFLLSVGNDIVRFANILEVIASTTAHHGEPEKDVFQMSEFRYGR
ncbi:hypothetical protein EHRUM3_01070 [Ehrlichia ruminantium]|uniref:DUF3514 domain-containing protein n=1 Tax=Ehrlichia ruminantium TaxID=779 RepID=A0A170SD35_EHRRU|nr:hypothetical protein [Ehrlichia ruminantium]GAT77905.1 hypothetical protein EHRUM3_01070 [Ehrlichia ruminantium]